MNNKSKNEQEQKQQRKKYEQGGGQKMISFRLDNRLAAWLKSKPNMGRYINNLISNDMKSAWTGDDEHTDYLDRLQDYEP